MADVALPVLPSKALGGKSEYKADFAKYLVHHDVLRELSQIKWADLSPIFVDIEKVPTAEALPQKAASTERLAQPNKLSVGIVGAGISGLYTAWICQVLKIDWHIYEASPERLGGRLYTHWFNEGSAVAEPVLHDYYDIGAMRFPYTPIMDRTFRVIRDTNTATGIYIMKDEAENQPSRYNDITQMPPYIEPAVEDPKSFDKYKVAKISGGPVPDATVRYPDLILDDAYTRFREKIKRALEMPRRENESEAEWRIRKELASSRAWEFLLKHDRFSLRDYLTFVEGETFETSHWLETLNAGTGWFDQAFTENVLDTLAFDYYAEENAKKKEQEAENPVLKTLAAPDAKAEAGKWYYIKNGSSSLVTNVLRKLEQLIVEAEKSGDKVSEEVFPQAKPKDFPNVMKRISIGKRVVSISRDEKTQQQPMSLTYVDSLKDKNDNKTTKRYDVVFNSTTFGALQRMDLLGLDLPYDTKAAIRSLRYDASTKVAIRFKKQWWVDKEVLDVSIQGGLGKTDMPLRTCVYPSYNIHEAPAVLLCSYTWGADSERVASMIDDAKVADPLRKDELKATDQLAYVMLDNLARLHTKNQADYEKLFKYISSPEVFDTYHAHDWTKDLYSCGGAFALFSPSQFSRTYPSVVRPLADGRFHIIGEAASAHHAWVVGALDSAARAMYLMLGRFKLEKEQEILEDVFGKIGEVDKATDYLQIALGMLPSSKRACATPAP